MIITTETLKPAGYHVLLKPHEVVKEHKVAGTDKSIILETDQEQERKQAGYDIHTLVAKGPDCWKDPDKFPTGNWAETGDIVMTPRYPGHQIKIDGEIYWMANDEDILATVEKKS